MPAQGCCLSRRNRAGAESISKALPPFTRPSSSQRNGIATGAPGRARNENDATLVAPRPLRR